MYSLVPYLRPISSQLPKRVFVYNTAKASVWDRKSSLGSPRQAMNSSNWDLILGSIPPPIIMLFAFVWSCLLFAFVWSCLLFALRARFVLLVGVFTMFLAGRVPFGEIVLEVCIYFFDFFGFVFSKSLSVNRKINTNFEYNLDQKGNAQQEHIEQNY